MFEHFIIWVKYPSAWSSFLLLTKLSRCFCPKVFSLCLISWQKSSCDKICRAAIGANPLRANKGAIWPKLPNTTSYCSKQSRQRVQCEVYFKLKPSNILFACRGCKYSSILRTDRPSRNGEHSRTNLKRRIQNAGIYKVLSAFFFSLFQFSGTVFARREIGPLEVISSS